jgi:hypothetical protein
MADDELTEQLRALGRGLTVRVPEGLSDRVMADIHASPAGGSRWRRWMAALGAMLGALGVTVAVSAPVRAGLMDIFGFGGIEVHTGPGPAPAASPTLPGEHATDLAAAQAEVGFRIRVPSALGEPESITVADGRVVSLHYPGVRIDQFTGSPRGMWEKYSEAAAQHTTVDGNEALWFDGPVTLVYVDAHGAEHTSQARRTDSSLVWMDGGLMFRIGGVRPLDAALTIARSMT